eukprot:238229-Chlamydomonas_euryale.AAC.5
MRAHRPARLCGNTKDSRHRRSTATGRGATRMRRLRGSWRRRGGRQDSRKSPAQSHKGGRGGEGAGRWERCNEDVAALLGDCSNCLEGEHVVKERKRTCEVKKDGQGQRSG